MRGRGLSPEFMTALKNGILSPILKAVQTDKDFIMEIREDYINIYYKGGSILKLTRQGKEYTAFFEIKYAKGNPRYMDVKECLKTKKITILEEADKWANNIRFFKSIMDYHSSIATDETLEKSVQQLIVQENNNWRTSNSTDYFIIDFEYANTQYDTRFDLVGLFWEGDKNIRRKPKDCRLVIIEVKYGDGSLEGDSGLIAHIIKAKNFLNDKVRVKDFKEEMVNVFKQKRELDILNIKNSNEVSIGAINDTIDFLFIIAGHNPGSSVLKRVLSKMEQEIKETDVKFAMSSFVGYALFKENIKDFPEFMRLLKQ